MKKNLLVIFLCLTALPIAAQNIRTFNNDGVEEFEKKNYSDAEIKFRKGLEQDPENKILKLNLGGSYYKQDKFDEALTSYNESVSKLADKYEKSKAYYNLGNSLLKQDKYKESIEAYKNSLRNNPSDTDAKYNLSYAIKKQQEQEQQDKNKDKNKDQDKKDEDKKDQDKKDQDKKDQDKKDQEDKNKDQQNKNDQQQQDPKNKQKQPEKPKISKEDAEKILAAMKNNEKEMQKKLRKKEGVKVQVEKDW